MAQQRRQLSVAGKQGSCNSKLFFTTSAHATSGRGFLHLRKCLKCTLYTEVLPNGETTYTLESSVSSLTIQNTTNSTRNQIQPEKKKGQVENIHSSRLAPFCSPETWPCIFRHLPQDHWDRRQLRLPLFSFCSLRILVAFTYSPNINLASTIPRALSIHEYPRYSNGYPMCILSILSPAFPA